MAKIAIDCLVPFVENVQLHSPNPLDANVDNNNPLVLSLDAASPAHEDCLSFLSFSFLIMYWWSCNFNPWHGGSSL